MIDLTDWPLSPDVVADLARRGESDVIEYKRQWQDLDVAANKAQLAKSVLALANTVQVHERAYLLVGVRDEKEGGGIVGVIEPPDPERVITILSNYTMPPINARCRHHETPHGVVSVLEMRGSPAKPHHAPREHGGVLSLNTVYVRRDRVIATLTLPEIEMMIREKDARLGPIRTSRILACGFVGSGAWDTSRVVTARITNLADEPIGGIEVFFDVQVAREPGLFYRLRKLSNVTLEANESREAEFRMNEVTFYQSRDTQPGVRELYSIRDFGTRVGERWLNTTLRVYFRDRDGFIQEETRHLAVDW